MSETETVIREQFFMSDTIGALAAALAKAQGVMGGAKKGATNPHLKNKYADLASVMDAVKEPLSSNGLALSQLIENEGESVAVRTLLLHESGEWLMSRVVLAASGNKGVNDAQAMGSTISYLRRYSASGITGLHQEDDDAASAGKKAEKEKPAEPSDDQTKKAKEIADNLKEATNTPHLQNKWSGFGGNDDANIPLTGELAKLPEILQKRLRATYDLVHGELTAKFKAEKDAEADPLAQDAERGEGK